MTIFNKCIIKIYKILIICLLLISGTCSANASDMVTKVNVNISSNQAIPERALSRMSASVAIVGQQILVGKSIDEIASNKIAYEKLIAEVFDRALVGYSVQAVNIQPGIDTTITIEIKPWGEVVQNVELAIDFNGISPELTALLKNDIGNIDDKVNGVLVGLPIDAVDWAGGASKAVIKEILAEKLPEFRADLDITAAAHTVIKLSLTPTGQVINDVNVSLRSHTIPNVLLEQARPAAEASAKLLNGLPVGFVERHQDYFADRVRSAVANQPLSKKYGLSVNPIITTGQDTDITLMAETNKYNLSLEGYLDMGRTEDSTSARLHAGKFLDNHNELFMQVDFIPSSISWKFTPGLAHHIGTNTQVGIKYNATDKEILWANQEYAKNWTLRLERTPANNNNELGIRYKLNDYVSAEYVINKDEHWLRLIGNL